MSGNGCSRSVNFWVKNPINKDKCPKKANSMFKQVKWIAMAMNFTYCAVREKVLYSMTQTCCRNSTLHVLEPAEFNSSLTLSMFSNQQQPSLLLQLWWIKIQNTHQNLPFDLSTALLHADLQSLWKQCATIIVLPGQSGEEEEGRGESEQDREILRTERKRRQSSMREVSLCEGTLREEVYHVMI